VRRGWWKEKHREEKVRGGKAGLRTYLDMVELGRQEGLEIAAELVGLLHHGIAARHQEVGDGGGILEVLEQPLGVVGSELHVLTTR